MVSMFGSDFMHLQLIKYLTDEEPKVEKVTELINTIIASDVLFLLARNLRLLSFTARKDAQTIFSYAFRFRPANSTADIPPALAHVIFDRPKVVVELCRGYAYKESAMSCGTVLREILKNDNVAATVLYDESKEDQPAIRNQDINLNQPQTGDGVFWDFFNWIDRSAFEVSADAFTTFRVCFFLSLYNV